MVLGKDGQDVVGLVLPYPEWNRDMHQLLGGMIT